MACPHPLPAVNPTNSTRLARAVVAVAAVLSLAVSNDCRAEEIYSALTEATGGALGTQFGDKYIALGFRTTATDYRLTSIDMGIRVVDSEVPGPGPFDPAVIVPRSGSVTFSIYGADESGAPPMVSNFIQNISSSIPVADFPDGAASNPVYSLTGLNVTLSPSTYYYLVANYPDSPDNGNLLWSQGIVDSSNPAYSNHYSGSTDGTTWGFPQLNNQNPLKATINAVPEPSTLALAAIAGLGGLAMLRRRKRSTSAA